MTIKINPQWSWLIVIDPCMPWAAPEELDIASTCLIPSFGSFHYPDVLGNKLSAHGTTYGERQPHVFVRTVSCWCPLPEWKVRRNLYDRSCHILMVWARGRCAALSTYDTESHTTNQIYMFVRRSSLTNYIAEGPARLAATKKPLGSHFFGHTHSRWNLNATCWRVDRGFHNPSRIVSLSFSVSIFYISDMVILTESNSFSS